MSRDLIWKIDNIFQVIKQPIDIIYKLTAIEKFKGELGINKAELLSESYFKSLKDKKESGAVYTPKEIAQYMIENTIEAENIINNAFIKIIDPACGTGNIIVLCFMHLKRLYEENLKEINKANKLNLNAEEISNHIIKNNLFGFDIDETALKILLIDLLYTANNVEINNFKNEDFLFYEENEKFDIFIGNPPYIGHKSIDKDYALKLKEKYKGLYSDKGDIAYCFYGASLNNIYDKGKITFISSRYFIESPSGESLRRILKSKCSIRKVVDFYGVRPFKNAGIDPIILFLEQGERYDNIEVIKPKPAQESIFLNSFYKNDIKGLQSFNIYKYNLEDSGWILINNKEKNIIDKIKNKCTLQLQDICESFQGIVTGCDKAFIIDENAIEVENLEKDIIKPWIKSSFINKACVNRQNKFIIYSNLIKSETNYTNCLEHIKNYKEKLVERRECKKGIRLWYELQWGRVNHIFEGTKIVFPYKSSNNRFAIDTGSYFSADVYCMYVKSTINYNYEFLVSILNSKLYEFYFKSFAKKLGENLYDYYPNTVMKLMIPPMHKIEGEIDSYLFKYFQLTEEEIEIIVEKLKAKTY
jgi:adenine-specific DNA-methyltransferase